MIKAKLKITDREWTIMEAAAKHNISEVKKTYYLLGGHGTIKVQYHPNTLHHLANIGYLERVTGFYSITNAGRFALTAREEALK